MSAQTELSKNICAYRKARRMTQEDLACEASISASHVRLLESGRGNPTLETIQNIAEAMNMEAGQILLSDFTVPPKNSSVHSADLEKAIEHLEEALKLLKKQL